MRLNINLRGRVALIFAAFGAVISLSMAVAQYRASHDASLRLIDETLTAELDDYIARRERNPASLPPSTVVLQGYVRARDGGGAVPDYLANLSVGRHDIRLGTLSYRVAALERGGEHYYLLYDTSLQARREQRLLWTLGLLTVTMTLLAALAGIWLARAVVAPVASLAAKVRHRRPEDWETPLADDFPSGEVGELARVFDRQLGRMRAFIERERAFSADISHELRTALAVILSATEVLLDDEHLDDKRKARIHRIQRAARDMSELGTVLLLMAREENSFGLGGACVPAEIIDDVVDKQRHLLAGKNVEVIVETDPSLTLAADPGLLEILVSNLIRNAFAYTATGSVTIRQDKHTLTVSDTGKGISHTALGQVFMRHFRDMASDGAGIGLSLVKRIGDRYGWRIKLESTENQGTSIRITFH